MKEQLPAAIARLASPLSIAEGSVVGELSVGVAGLGPRAATTPVSARGAAVQRRFRRGHPDGLSAKYLSSGFPAAHRERQRAIKQIQNLAASSTFSIVGRRHDIAGHEMLPGRFTSGINERALRDAITLVDQYNALNAGSWADWSDANQVAISHGLALCEVGQSVIDRAIASDGASLAFDMPAVELAIWGQNFEGSFWSPDSI